MINERYGYYECSKCGHKSQVLKVIGIIDLYDEDWNWIGQTEELDMDCEASYVLACEHEKTHEE